MTITALTRVVSYRVHYTYKHIIIPRRCGPSQFGLDVNGHPVEGKYFGSVYRVTIFEAISMIPRQYLHVTHLSRVFVVVPHLYRTQACYPRPFVQRSLVRTCKQALLTRRRVLAPSSPPVRGWWFPKVFVVVLMVGDLLVRARGIHTPSPANPCTHFS